MNKLNRAGKVLIGILLCLSFVACNAKLEAKKDDQQSPPANPPADGPFGNKQTISGPSLTGHWVSSCAEKPFEDGQYRRFDIVINDLAIQRTEVTYSDSFCVKTPLKTQTFTGTFRFIDQYQDGSYDVEYRFKLQNGVTQITGEKIFRDQSLLFIGDFHLGEGMSVLWNEPLTLIKGVK